MQKLNVCVKRHNYGRDYANAYLTMHIAESRVVLYSYDMYPNLGGTPCFYYYCTFVQLLGQMALSLKLTIIVKQLLWIC